MFSVLSGRPADRLRPAAVLAVLASTLVFGGAGPAGASSSAPMSSVVSPSAGSPPFATVIDETGGAGVYKYGPGGGFPDQTWHASNYWVTPTFTTT